MLMDQSNDKKAKQRKQIADFISNLSDRTKALENWTNGAENRLVGEGFETYLEFRDLVIECESFNEIIQRRLATAKKDGEETDLQHQLDLLSAKQLTLAIRASLKFLRYLSEKNLPLGSRDVFIHELHELYRMKENLKTDRMKGIVDEQSLEDQKKVEEILNLVIHKAPRLFSFDNLDDPRKEDEE